MEKFGAAISMDRRGRAMENIFIERLWWTVEYEEVYLKSDETVAEAGAVLARYFLFYNAERLHESLGIQTPVVDYINEGRLRNKVFFLDGEDRYMLR